MKQLPWGSAAALMEALYLLPGTGSLEKGISTAAWKAFFDLAAPAGAEAEKILTVMDSNLLSKCCQGAQEHRDIFTEQ